MSKFIQVSGDGDFSVVDFLSSDLTISDIYKEMLEKGVTIITKTITVDDDYEDELCFTLYEFNDVDPAFVEYVKNNLCDYDALKACDIFEV